MTIKTFPVGHCLSQAVFLALTCHEGESSYLFCRQAIIRPAGDREDRPALQAVFDTPLPLSPNPAHPL